MVWEDKPEDIADQCERELPVLVEDKSKEIISDPKKPTHFILEGDNYHTLYTLNFTHKKKIDVIYIDPPYNTGNNDFIYNDSFVDKVDRYRHSKWLSFMNKRLRLSKNLLKDSGVIFISIGEDEQSQLKMLCDKVYGQNNFITIVPRIAKKTSDKGTYFKPTKDYILVYAKSITRLDGFGLEKTDNINKYKYKDDVGIYKKNGASLYQPSLDSRPNQRKDSKFNNARVLGNTLPVRSRQIFNLLI